MKLQIGPLEKPLAQLRRSLDYSESPAAKQDPLFAIDVLQCDRCGGKMRIVSPIHPPEATRKILECLGLPSCAPPIAPAAPSRVTESEA